MTTCRCPLGPPIERAILEEDGTGQSDPEMAELAIGLDRLGIPARFVPAKRLHRRQEPVKPTTLVAGSIPYVRAGLAALGIKPPPFEEYPACLRPYLGRRFWSCTVSDLLRDIETAGRPAVFAKPEFRRKRFTGHVFAAPEDRVHLEGASRHTRLRCAEVVEWLTEHRIFVHFGEVVGIRPYAGNENLAIDLDCAREAIAILEASGWTSRAYAADFGLLSDGRTALVELNDAWGLGSWGLDPDVYTSLIMTRWRELTGSRFDRFP